MRRWLPLTFPISLIAFLFSLIGCITPAPRPQPVPGPDRTQEYVNTCTQLYAEELHRAPDPIGLQGCINQARAGGTAETIRANIRLSPEWIALNSFHPLPPITVDGTIFRVNGQPWVLKGVTAFQLMDRWVKGENIQPFLDAYAGFNTLYVFSYTPANVWGAQAWESPTPAQAVAFVKAMNQKGWYVELSLLTNADAARVQPAKDILAALSAVRMSFASNVLIRLGNEPAEQNGAGNPPYDTHVLKAAADASGFVYDSGFYEANGSTWFGDYISPHTKRDAEAPRRGHDCFDITHGASDAPQLGKKAVPCVLGEPQKAGLSTPGDYKAYCATGVQFGVGCVLHSETGKYAQLPTPQEAAVAAAALAGMSAFPGDTNRGAYRRIDGDGLRTYVVGGTMVRIRPNRPPSPEPGWTSLDSDGILWKR